MSELAYKYNMLLSTMDLSNPMPHLSQFHDLSGDGYGCDEGMRTWKGIIGDYDVHITLSESILTLSWGGEVIIRDAAGAEIGKMKTMKVNRDIKDAYITLCKKLDRKLRRLQRKSAAR